MGAMKWIAGLLGFAFGGGIFGGVIGYAVGSLLEKMIKKEYDGNEQKGDFVMGLLILTAAVMKADGKVMKSELNFVKDFLQKNFGRENLQNKLDILRQLLDKNIDVYQACEKIRTAFPYATKLQLLHYLFGIAVADNDCTKSEKDLIERIANLIGLSGADYKSIEAMYFEVTDSAYVILQVDKNASDAEVKKAYKRMCIKYHPDKVANLGEDAQQAANAKFQEINNAYEKIKKERNIV
ncbi:MAG: TerB family tellurite resistance protein [Candidatus Onthomorpha sp.]|nr:TerB family tellurite resistance protein [Bacteroidales bacterium]MDY3977967.1 TerB family tellurite resistance protein [Candidatus Onthomorpha sp.]MCI6417153.1 TerB family tellurite resistance protein [Bacteroidales bacterium]MCI6800980.1 TerB family tellurite resistance protein [Bacteroidales bacterium]MCI6900896.1 TerB family tellurite resistance protein [Bacteroidales bacterium]